MDTTRDATGCFTNGVYQCRRQELLAPVPRETDRYVASVYSEQFSRRIARKPRGHRLAPRPPTELLARRRFQTSLSLRWFTLIHTRVRDTAKKTNVPVINHKFE